MAGSNAKETQAHCNNCGGKRRAALEAVHSAHVTDDDIWVNTQYLILRCVGCDDVFFQTAQTCSEDFEIDAEGCAFHSPTVLRWPPQIKQVPPPWLESIAAKDGSLYQLLEDAYSAADAGLNVLAAIGIRTVFDRASELLEVEPAISFGEKLKALEAQHILAKRDVSDLSVLIDAGNAAAHRGWRPADKELADMFQLLEAFIARAFVIGDNANVLKGNVPEKPKRQKPVTPAPPRPTDP